LLAKILIDGIPEIASWHDPNADNLVKQVSIPIAFAILGLLHQTHCTYNPIKTDESPLLRIMAVDVGMKNNQIRCFLD
jgi:carbamoyl-phosphate synthase/aspartate carbamoyltransferase